MIEKKLTDFDISVKEKNPGESELKVTPGTDNSVIIEQADAEVETILKKAVRAKSLNPSKKQSKGKKPKDKKKAKLAKVSKKRNRRK